MLDDVTHLVSYTYKPIPGTPHFVLQPHLRIDNQLGMLFVDAGKRDVLLVPSNKDLSGPTSPPDDTTIGVDHYKCYKVRTTAGTPRFLSKTVSVADQFTSPAKQFVLKKIKHLCTAVSTNGLALKNPSLHLACYSAKPASGQPTLTPHMGVNTNNELGPLVFGIVKQSELCVPSLETLTP